jgi:hypothetical protein
MGFGALGATDQATTANTRVLNEVVTMNTPLHSWANKRQTRAGLCQDDYDRA